MAASIIGTFLAGLASSYVSSSSMDSHAHVSGTAIAKSQGKSRKSRSDRKNTCECRNSANTEFPDAIPLPPDEFHHAVNGRIVYYNEGIPQRRNPTSTELRDYCHRFAAWLRQTKDPRLAYLTPGMATGTLLDICRLIIFEIRHPNIIPDDHANRHGRAVVFGSAGVGSRASKMRRSLVSALVNAEHARDEFVIDARVKRELARELRAEGTVDDAAVAEVEWRTFALKAALEHARAREIRKILDSDNWSELEARYEACGGGG
jgi:hypothetical protein